MVCCNSWRFRPHQITMVSSTGKHSGDVPAQHRTCTGVFAGFMFPASIRHPRIYSYDVYCCRTLRIAKTFFTVFAPPARAHIQRHGTRRRLQLLSLSSLRRLQRWHFTDAGCQSYLYWVFLLRALQRLNVCTAFLTTITSVFIFMCGMFFKTDVSTLIRSLFTSRAFLSLVAVVLRHRYAHKCRQSWQF